MTEIFRSEALRTTLFILGLNTDLFLHIQSERGLAALVSQSRYLLIQVSGLIRVFKRCGIRLLIILWLRYQFAPLNIRLGGNDWSSGNPPHFDGEDHLIKASIESIRHRFRGRCVLTLYP